MPHFVQELRQIEPCSSCLLAQAVDVLRHNGTELSLPLQRGQRPVRGVRLRLQREHFFAVKAVEILRMLIEKRMAQDRFRRVFKLLVVKPVRAAEIRDAGLRGHTGSAEKDDIVTCFDPGF